MKASSIKTIFHLLGVGLLIPALVSFVIAFTPAQKQSDTVTVIATFSGFILAALVLYFLAGAPQLTRAIVRRFPEGPEPARIAPKNPRHKLKATIWITVGVLCSLSPFVLMLPWFDSQANHDAFGGTTFVAALLSPLIAVWGAVHLAWLRGHSAKIPITVGLVGFAVCWVLPIVGFVLATQAPVIVVLCLGRPGPRLRQEERA